MAVRAKKNKMGKEEKSYGKIASNVDVIMIVIVKISFSFSSSICFIFCMFFQEKRNMSAVGGVMAKGDGEQMISLCLFSLTKVVLKLQ